MDFSVATFVWTGSFTNGDIHLLRRIADMGYNAVEVVYDGSGGFDPARIAAGLNDARLGSSVLAFCLPDRDPSSSDPRLREAGIDYLCNAVDVAVTLGSRVVAGPIAHPPGRARALGRKERATERENAIASLRTVGDYANQRGVRLGVEVLSRYDSDMFNTADDAVVFHGQVAHPAVGLHLDTFHMQLEERSLREAIRLVGDRLVHFHATESHRGQLGTGQVRWDEVFSGLREIAYEGLVSIESFSHTGTEFDALVNMWRPWFEDPDEFASSGLAFMRDTEKSATR